MSGYVFDVIKLYQIAVEHIRTQTPTWVKTEKSEPCVYRMRRGRFVGGSSGLAFLFDSLVDQEHIIAGDGDTVPSIFPFLPSSPLF